MSQNRPVSDKRKAPKTAFKPGQSGNPGGRPKAVAEIRELARLHAPAMISQLAKLAIKAKSEQAQVAAIRELLDRGFGKSPQSLSEEGEDAIGTIVRFVTGFSNPGGGPKRG